jgi:hypothetical protein
MYNLIAVVVFLRYSLSIFIRGAVIRRGSDPDFPLKQIANPEIPGKKELIPNSRRIWTANWSKIVIIHIQLNFY